MADRSADHLPLGAEFAAASREDWLRLVSVVLKGAPYEQKLVGKTRDGLRIDALYERAAQARPLPGRAPAAPWQILQRVDHPDPVAANAQALEDLENGATGLTLVFAGAVGARGYGIDATGAVIARVLDGVHLDAGIALEFDLSPQTKDAPHRVAALLKARKVSPHAVDIRFGYDPLGALAAAGAGPPPWGEIAPLFAKRIAELAAEGFKGPFAAADARPVHAAGGSEAQELAFALASAVAYLKALEASGIALDAARRMIFFRLAADADQFLTMAKFRALRQLWARVEEACGLAPAPAFVSAETAWRMLTRRDPWVNMLRTTVATFAAGIGGANAITALPFTAALGLPDRLARRIARNAQLILLEESNLAKVSDPVAGAGGIEDLTAQLCRAAWTLFQEIEDGGWHGGRLGARPDPAAGCGRPRATRDGRRHPQGCADRHERILASRRSAGVGARCRASHAGGTPCRGHLRAVAGACGWPNHSSGCAMPPIACWPRPEPGRRSFWPTSACLPTSAPAPPSRRISSRPAASRP